MRAYDETRRRRRRRHQASGSTPIDATGVRHRSSTGSREPGLVERRGDGQPLPVLDRPDHEEGPPDDVRDRDRTVDPRVVRVVAMVTHHEQLTFRHRDVERLVGVGRRVGLEVDVGLDQGMAVDHDLVVGVAAHDVVAGDPDDPLDEVAARGRRDADGGADVVEEPQDRVARHRERVLVRPAWRSLEDDDLAAPRIAEVVDQLVDQHPVERVRGRRDHGAGVATLQRVLHRRGRDVERLDEEGLDQQREHQRHNHQNRQLAPERSGSGRFRGLGVPAGLAARVGHCAVARAVSATV